MKIILVCVLKLIYVSFVSTQAEAPNRLCHIAGASEFSITNIHFNVSDLPERCDEVVYGNFLFDSQLADDDYMYREDEDAIRELVAANKLVYVVATFEGNENWDEMFEPTDQKTYDDRIKALIAKVNDLKIGGIVLGITNLYDKTFIDYDQKVSAFIQKIKEQIPTLKFALPVSGSYSFELFSKSEVFDFTITNDVVNVYIVQMFTHNFVCTPEVLKDGSLITSPDTKALTLEKISNAVSQSSMDKNKTSAKMLVMVLKPDDITTTTTYLQYCDDTNVVDQWCADNIQKLHDEGEYVRKFFYGITMTWLDYDDPNGQCGCEPFPATNALLDGWEGVAVKDCPKLNKK